jgi:hypothetical protein
VDVIPKVRSYTYGERLIFYNVVVKTEILLPVVKVKRAR